MSEETRTCKRGHKMSSKPGKDGKRHYFCQKCRNAAARARRAGQGSSSRRSRAAALSTVFSSDALWMVSGFSPSPSSEDKKQEER